MPHRSPNLLLLLLLLAPLLARSAPLLQSEVPEAIDDKLLKDFIQTAPDGVKERPNTDHSDESDFGEEHEPPVFPSDETLPPPSDKGWQEELEVLENMTQLPSTTKHPVLEQDELKSETAAAVALDRMPQVQRFGVTTRAPPPLTESPSTVVPDTTTSTSTAAPTTVSTETESTMTTATQQTSTTSSAVVEKSSTTEPPPTESGMGAIPFWLKVVNGIRCSMRDCHGVLMPTEAYSPKELPELTITRFARKHESGLAFPSCPCALTQAAVIDGEGDTDRVPPDAI